MLSATLFAIILSTAVATPVQHAFDLQGHRGGRGEAIENSLHSFAWGMISGVKTLELDNGITKVLLIQHRRPSATHPPYKDGVVILFHDQAIPSEKCQDVAPAFDNDPDYPYVGKYIANLTLAQIKTLDCGSERLNDFPLQLIYPGAAIPSMQEVFDFVACADPKRRIQFNIESKIDPTAPTHSRGVVDFVNLQHDVFKKSGYPMESITYQSFDWRTLVAMKALEPKIPTAALVSRQVVKNVVNANADILSPSYVSNSSPVADPSQGGYIPFTTKAMVDRAHELGLKVVPWTVNRLNVADQLFDLGVDGIITDYPASMRRLIEQKGLGLSRTYEEKKVLRCLTKFI
ncbi:hypothetical protein C0991_008803 [Blastosporella zonata]|nr:hypothetical protein C0991_008803 [Blastosporella zonata]